MHISLFQRRLVLVVATLIAFAVMVVVANSIPTNNFTAAVHDPSGIIRCKNEYWSFATGNGIKTLRSKNLTNWEVGPPVLNKIPDWVADIFPRHRGYFWAPDVIYASGRYLLYYSVSGWGKNNSAIALLTNPTLDPSDPNYRWTDEGPVVNSKLTDDFNAIDPSLLLDGDGKLWMAFGSFWSGIKLVELDPATGKRIAPNSPLFSLAKHKQIEAPCITAHGGFYYLFVNWGLCCRGLRSTYEIRVGRSKNITGPYLDRDGVDLMADGGTLFLGNEGRYVGPGHAGVFREGNEEWLSYHFYDGEERGTSRLAVRRLRWDVDGWPVAGERRK